ncbi:MAG: hypothetical protein IKV38_01155 [Clostridia bacterium]|nr:hypothetical protein [Clostridia bacterium]
MISNICKIKNNVNQLDSILQESEKVAVYNQLTHKQSLQLRLLCEEINGMLPRIIDDFDGELWFEFKEGICKVNVDIRFDEYTANKKKELISISKSKKNAAAVGIVGKIRSALETFFLDDENLQAYNTIGLYHMATEYSVGIDYAYLWSLNQYKNTVKEEKKQEAWDELEKSIIASIADDVIVGVKGKQATITIIKNFA